MIGFEFPSSWAGTAGAVSITFAIFYAALKYSPFRTYAPAVRSALQDWYRKRFVLYSLLASSGILLFIILFVEIGYQYHGDRIVSISELGTVDGAQKQLSNSIGALKTLGYSWFDALSITIASVDKSLDGYYLKSANFILAENLEIMVFLVVMKKAGTKFFAK